MGVSTRSQKYSWGSTGIKFIHSLMSRVMKIVESLAKCYHVILFCKASHAEDGWVVPDAHRARSFRAFPVLSGVLEYPASDVLMNARISSIRGPKNDDLQMEITQRTRRLFSFITALGVVAGFVRVVLYMEGPMTVFVVILSGLKTLQMTLYGARQVFPNHFITWQISKRAFIFV